ncbi:MAG TPA: hypothetical protein PK294_09775 [Ignavibacteria bacterium]|nr:hypothetical protein [Ignavibacteria bacterium]HQY53342.1 hypothetical protein [Ignavibacteria bacterium]HRB00711.1 hypothetical protein [Ignavibacteria bacterium]
MKKIKSVPVKYLLVFIFSVTFFYSCSDDPVSNDPVDPTYQYDSARFSWKVDTLYGPGFFAGLWAKDTNDIFITNTFSSSLYRIQNGVKSYISYPVNTYLGVVTGDEMNNGFVIGGILIDTLVQPFFQKFDGNSFIEIPNPQNLKQSLTFNAVFVKNENEMWIGANGYILKFDGVNLYSFQLEDSRTKALKFFYDEFNNFKLLASIHHLDTDRTEFIIYEYTGSQWINIFSDIDSPRPLRYNIFNKYVSAANLNTIFELTGNTLTPKVTITPPGSGFTMDGYSFNNILVPARKYTDFCRTSLFHWNGIKWSLELCNYWVDPTTDVYMINENYYYVVSYNQNGTTFIMQGKKNN